ncbi:MAG: GTPase Era [Eubacteriales bacterium]|nr:GTPase Era [Eubacteriales bacterium]
MSLKTTIIKRQRQPQLAASSLELLDQALSLAFEQAFDFTQELRLPLALAENRSESEEAASLDLGQADLHFRVTLSLVSPARIKEINEEQRGLAKVTDVLSFPLLNFQEGRLLEDLAFQDFLDPGAQEPEVLLGDILICPARAAQQAENYGHSLERELAFLAVHGLLHLLGYDHEELEEEQRMRRLQTQVLSDLGLGLSPSDQVTLPAHRLEEAEKSLNQGQSLEELLRAAGLQAADNEHPPIRKSGFIALLGRPNVGKSTLLNHLMGSKLAITSYKPQTTRTMIRGVLEDEGAQMAFLDTPGLHPAKHSLDRYMSKAISLAMSEADIFLLLIDARFKPRVEEEERRLAQYAKDRGKVLFILLNKADLAQADQVLPLIQAFDQELAADEIIPLSAKTGEGVDILLDQLKAYLPKQGPLFASEDFTNQTQADIAAELIRQQVLLQMQEEIPHGTAVKITDFQEGHAEQDQDELVEIQADIICDRPGHKAMLLGKGGSRIKTIRQKAQREISRVLGVKCKLSLFVRVKEGWRNRQPDLADLGYKIQDLEID